jgi:hypothetical protein
MLYPLSYGGDDGDATNEPAGAQSRPASVLAEPSLLNREGGPRAGLDVLPSQVVDTADGRAADGGVVAVMVVHVQPFVECAGSSCF